MNIQNKLLSATLALSLSAAFPASACIGVGVETDKEDAIAQCIKDDLRGEMRLAFDNVLPLLDQGDRQEAQRQYSENVSGYIAANDRGRDVYVSCLSENLGLSNQTIESYVPKDNYLGEYGANEIRREFQNAGMQYDTFRHIAGCELSRIEEDISKGLSLYELDNG